MDVEFAHQAGAIGVHGLGTQVQARGDLLAKLEISRGVIGFDLITRFEPNQ